MTLPTPEQIDAMDLPFDVSPEDAAEIAEHFRVKARDEFLADMAIVRDADGFPEDES